MTSRQQTRDLDAYVEEIEAIVGDELSAPETVERIVTCNRRLIASGLELPPELKRMHPGAPYTRNLVHKDPENRFAVIAIIWGPFQETLVHDHLNWCVVGVLEGSCLAVDYDRLDDGSQPGHAEIAVRDAYLAPAGTVMGLTPPPSSNVHKMSNSRRDPAISLHTYGDPGTKARIFEPATGRVEVRQLEFHNLEA